MSLTPPTLNSPQKQGFERIILSEYEGLTVEHIKAKAKLDISTNRIHSLVSRGNLLYLQTKNTPTKTHRLWAQAYSDAYQASLKIY